MEELKVIESELVPVYVTDRGMKVVYGLELHEALKVKSNYREWITRRFDDIEAVENKEYQAVEISTPSGQAKKNHIIKLNTAKEMAMLERNEKGKQVRRYFIRIEEKYKNQLIDNGGSVVRIYKNNGWGVMLMDNEVYNLTPKEMEAVARLIPGMKKKGIKEIKLVLEAFLEYSERGSKLKEMASWGIDNPEKPKTQEDESGYILNLTAKQAQSRYGISRDKLNEIAEEAQAVVDIGNRKLYNREIIDEYFREAAKKQAQITAEGGECK